MADVHNNPNTRSEHVGTRQADPNIEQVPIRLEQGFFAGTIIGYRNANAHELQTHENETARKGGK